MTRLRPGSSTRRLSIAFAFAVALGFSAQFVRAQSADSAPPPAPPKLRLPAGVVPVRYSADWTIDPARDRFDGRVEIELSVARPTPVVWLNATDLEVREAVLTGSGAPRTARIVPGGGDFVGFAFDPPVPAGASSLAVTYTAKMSATDTAGVFHQKAGDDWYVFSQFESIWARRAVPCFDEPSFKVPWRMTLRIPPGLTAVSNAPIETERREDGGRVVVVFKETPPMPAYLLAIGVGPFEIVDAGRVGKNSVPVRILVPKGRTRETRYAVSIQKEMMDRLEAYFGIPYPYEKLDHLVIPHTVRFGAMENAGLITWTETFLLAPPEEETAIFTRLYTVVALHEIAHQWFGDYVTLAWWDDTWLNESFATWVSEKLTREWRPEWNRGVAMVLDRSDTLDRDTLKTSRRIRQPILSNADIDNAFDDISYGKGGAVLAMFEKWVGPEKFRSGIHAYLSAHAWKNATSEDFLAALEKAGGPGVARSLSTFLDQPGFPLITASVKCGPGSVPRLELRQSRLLPKGSSDPSAKWRVPVCARWGNAAGRAGEGRACTLLAEDRGELPLTGAPAGSCPDWVLANEGEVGYYRVAYAGDLQERLLAARQGGLDLAERAGVLGDVKALASLGQIPIEQALALVPEFARDRARQVAVTAAEIAEIVDDHLVEESLRPNYERFLRRAFSERARELSWTPSPSESDDAQLLRPTLLKAAAAEGRDPELRKQGAALGRRWLDDRSAVSSSLVSLALQLAAREGDAALFDRMVEEARRAKAGRDHRRIYAALGSFLDPAVERRALALILDPAFDSREAIQILWSALGDRRTRDVAWDFFRTNYDALAARLPQEYLPVLPRAGEVFCNAKRREEVRAFFEPRIGKIEGAERPLAQTLEKVGQCEMLAASQRAGVEKFLSTY
jgi:alanyl aminopeptidase